MFADAFAHPDGRARFVAVEHVGTAEPTDAAYPLHLTTGRVLAQYQSGAQTRRVRDLPDTGPYVENLRGTMQDLELGFDAWAEYCPRCKRVLRGNAYLTQVKKGFK